MLLTLSTLTKRIGLYCGLGIAILYQSTGCLFSADLNLGLHYKTAQELIVRGDIKGLFEKRDEIEGQDRGLRTHLKGSEITHFCTEAQLDADTTSFLKTSLQSKKGKSILLGDLVGFIFYPHNLLMQSVKTNYNQLSASLKNSILLSALYGFEPACALIKFSGLGKLQTQEIKTLEDLSSSLKVPFCFEDVGFLNQTKKLVRQGNNLQLLEANTISSKDSPFLLNVGYLFKFLNLVDKAEETFKKAVEAGSKRALIELGFLLLEKDFAQGEAFFRSDKKLEESGLKAYGCWKLAQCYWKGHKTDRNLEHANRLYQDAVRLSTHTSSLSFPEIYYDVGEFALYCALGHPDDSQKRSALQQALAYFQKAAAQGMSVAFIKEAEIAEKLMDLGQAPADIFFTLISRVLTSGNFAIAEQISKKQNLPLPPPFSPLKKVAEAEQLQRNNDDLHKKAAERAKTW